MPRQCEHWRAMTGFPVPGKTLHTLDDIHDLGADALLRLDGGSADVRRAADHGMAVQSLVGGGFVGVHVQTGGALVIGKKKERF